MTQYRDKVEGDLTEAYQFDGTDEGGQLRQALRNSESVPSDAEVVVGSGRLYLTQYADHDSFDSEIVEREDWLVWDSSINRWAIYPPRLFEKYFEAVPDER